MTWVHTIEQIDKLLFLLIHTDADSNWLDPFMLQMRNAYTWVPLYFFILFYAIIKTGRHFWTLLFACLLAFAVGDFISAQLLKPFFERARPCYDADLQSFIRPIINCGGYNSFPSTHATNHFALAMLFFLFFKQYAYSIHRWVFVWAALICYAQVYVGKHFPLDVAAGALLGTVIGTAAYKLIDKLFKVTAVHKSTLGKTYAPPHVNTQTENNELIFG